jgi:hypothetical protein
MDQVISQLAMACYNGACLARENGDTEAYEVGGVSAPKGGVRGQHFTVRLVDGSLVLVQVLPV